MRLNLFKHGDFTLNSGEKSEFKIDCDALTVKDWRGIAHLINKRISFSQVIGVPRGGLPLEAALKPYIKADARCILLVDDVYTTGGSIDRFWESIAKTTQRSDAPAVVGYVVFARKPIAPVHSTWVNALFTLDCPRP